jgi:ArsR family transcriptional regulator
MAEESGEAGVSTTAGGEAVGRGVGSLLSDEQFLRISRALADPTRFAILRAIASCGEEETSCRALFERFEVSAATISHHTRELGEAGLIEARRAGKCGFWRPRHETLRAYQATLAARLTPGAGDWADLGG